jgi:glycosyltransferase involved in cell wall biosynthesis
MAIKESMAYGCIPVVTALEGNKMHLTHKSNALLIDRIDDEEAVVAGGIRWLKLLTEDEELRTQLSDAAFQYASEHFNRQRFMEEYKAFLLPATGKSRAR